ncbi:MAG: transcriptional regulator [Desulfobacterales bacterium]
MPTVPPQKRSDTIRRTITNLLEQAPHNARELSKIIGIPEKDIVAHLPHIGRSASVSGKKLTIVPAKCLSCGYVFKDRKRFSRPGRCPACRNTHIEAPSYRIEHR